MTDACYTTDYALSLCDEPGGLRITEKEPVMIVRKRADQDIYPFTVTPPRTMEWPLLIIETAYSEPRSQISDDIWNPEISIEQFELINKPTKAISPQWVIEPIQSIAIEATKKNEDSVVNGHFRIPFRSIFLREPKYGEADLVMEKDDVLQIARQVWREKSREARLAWLEGTRKWGDIIL